MKMRLYFLFLLILASMLFSTRGSSEIKFIETSYGEDKPMSKKILVAYASKAGSTSEVADFIGKTLADKGAVADVKQLKNIRDITGYQAVVIGSAIRAGRLLPEAVDFVKHYKADLQKTPVAYFIVCMTMKDNTEENRKKADSFLDPLRNEIAPVSVGLFAGKMDYSKLGFASRSVVKHMVKVPEGDFRNWDSIKKWADNLLPKLTSVKIQK